MKASKLIIPIVLLLYSFANIVYYKSWFFDFDKKQWGGYFHVLHQLQALIWCVILLWGGKRTYIDNQFIKIAGCYNAFLIICYLYRHLTGDVKTEHIIIIIGSIFIFSATMIRSAFKHKYFAQ